MLLSDVIIVLSRPAEAGNVGAVCRAMKNMGLSRLRLATPEFSVRDEVLPEEAHDALSKGLPNAGSATTGPWSLSEAGFGYGGNPAIIKARAIHAFDVWEKAETFSTLTEAVHDCALIIGTTRRRGRRRKQVTMTPAETVAFLAKHPGPAALVFGNERTGLEDDELELCNFASHIPASDVFPSLNLSHAVQIYAYELFQALACPAMAVASGATTRASATAGQNAVKGQWVPLDAAAVDILVKDVTDNLKQLGFYKQIGREEQKRFFRDVFSRAALTEREGKYFAGIIAKAVRLAQKANR